MKLNIVLQVEAIMSDHEELVVQNISEELQQLQLLWLIFNIITRTKFHITGLY